MPDKNAPAPNLILGEADGGRLADNIMHFGRVLRRAGLPVGPGKILDAINAVTTVGVTSREDFYWALHAVFVNRRDQREVFDQAFHVFWRNPNLLEKMLSVLLPSFKGDEVTQQESTLSRRVAEAMAQEQSKEGEGSESAEQEEELELDATLTFSGREVLNNKDFEKMTTQELAEARDSIKRLLLPLGKVKTRRFERHSTGPKLDMHATMRASVRRGGDMILMRRKRPRQIPPPLVILCDISGSMDRYARMLLHFMHALTNDRDRVHTFLFGTRLTNITRYLRYKDPDDAIDRVTEAVEDWSGGTRIGQTLHDFNKNWSRRVLGQGAVVLLITDGLDRDGAAGLSDEMARLHRSCRRLIWLNPLLRYDQYSPKSLGARAMMRHVDEFRPIHNLESLSQLADALKHDHGMSRQDMARWKEMAA
ncbi:vWA domain-containing protein [Aestuariispira ectoiniformans]|uniref:vWA domain-containing protein n=1 Tax=Aestuariispira ectoiniformans TaxID=2775080 RepID=UPI00223BB7E0|nr:VWA domain-containing protein [Aestuariispira ectoiniformans]